MKNDRKPIGPTLRKLEINQTDEFEFIQYGAVCSTIHRLSTMYDFKFTQKKNNETRKIEVTRIA